MTLKETIEKDLIESMKEKDENTLSVLRMLKSAVKNKEIEAKKELEDADITTVIQSQIKSRRDSVEMYEKADRKELAEKEKAEIEILQKYLPEQMSEEDIRSIVQKAVNDTGAAGIQDMCKVMGKIMPEVKGKADGSLVSSIVKEKLSK